MEPGWFRQSGSLLCFDIDKVCVGMECSFQACTCAGLFRYMHKDATDTDVSPCSFFPITTDCYTYVSFTRVITPLVDPAQPPTNETRMLSILTADPAAARKGNFELRHEDKTTLQPANRHSDADQMTILFIIRARVVRSLEDLVQDAQRQRVDTHCHCSLLSKTLRPTRIKGRTTVVQHCRNRRRCIPPFSLGGCSFCQLPWFIDVE